jgi:hypothetical protein
METQLPLWMACDWVTLEPVQFGGDLRRYAIAPQDLRITETAQLRQRPGIPFAFFTRERLSLGVAVAHVTER